MSKITKQNKKPSRYKEEKTNKITLMSLTCKGKG